MGLHRRRLRRLSRARRAGGLSLILAKIIVALEAYASAFALPALVLSLFVAFAWLGVFTALYPWPHLVILVIFTAWFFVALRQAKERYEKPSRTLARRRLEAANRLAHRPLDVIEDRPVITNEAQRALWKLHVARSRAQLKKLHPPRWGLSFADRDPYAVRYITVILLAVGLCFSWGGWGQRLVAALDPAIRLPWHATPLTMNAWITPPEYTGLPPIMIATPAGLRHTADVIDVPEGSVLSVHLAETTRAPMLELNGVSEPLQPDEHGDLVATRTITAGDMISLQRHWYNLGKWKIHVIADQPPQVAITEPPTSTERKTTRLAFDAKDDYGVQSISVKLTPTMSMPGTEEASITLPLSAAQGKHVKQTDYEDLTALPWAGLPVNVQLVAADAAGHTAESDAVTYNLPERNFNNPLARALIEERKKLLTQPDETTRNEAANVMAGIAREPVNYHGDPVVMMALRTGAVRLVLDRDDTVVPAVRGLLWQSALKIEDGTMNTAQDLLHQAQRELADALNRNASEAEVQQLIDKLQNALALYLQQLATRAGQQPDAGIERMMGSQVNVLTPEDLKKMLDDMRNLSATGSREVARQRLAQLQHLLENLRTTPPQLTAEQKQMLTQMKGLHDLAKEQQKLLDKTFSSQRSGKPSAEEQSKLSDEQRDLLSKLNSLMPKDGNADGNMRTGSHAMESASGDLKRGDLNEAMKRQGEAIAAMQRGLQAMMEKLQKDGGMDEMGQGLPGGERDPFGRTAGQSMDDGGVQVPEQMNIRRAREILDELQRRAGDGARPKLERDYIDRLLERF